MFSRNICRGGQITRFVLGALLLAGAYKLSSWILAALGAFCLFEAAMGWCIVRAYWGGSCPIEKKQNKRDDKPQS
jgi:hypothetical protein